MLSVAVLFRYLMARCREFGDIVFFNRTYQRAVNPLSVVGGQVIMECDAPGEIGIDENLMPGSG
jgi:hypothetical protein